MSFQGIEFTPEMIQMIVNLKKHFDVEKKSGKSVSTKNAVKRVATGLGIGEITVKRIMADYNKGKIKSSFSKKDRGKPPFRISDNFQPMVREYIRKKNLKGLKITAEEIHANIKTEFKIEIPMTTFLRTLNRWGFTYGKGKRRCGLKERDYVVLARRHYLRQKIRNRKGKTNKRPEVYLDETYINKNHSNQFTWYSDEDGPWVNKPSGKGPRFIILNAITKDGWVNDAQLVFEAKKRTGDYHGQMNWDNFSKWFKGQLLPNIPKNSLIVMDNAPYHNVFTEETFPTIKTLKKDLCEWLDRNHIPWTEDMLKPELFKLCKRFAPQPEYKIDKIAELEGHKILRTPQYHPELQPIETCWAVVKNYMADKCDFTIENFRNQLPRAFKQVTSYTCEKVISEVADQERKFWKEDSHLYNKVDENEDLDIL